MVAIVQKGLATLIRRKKKKRYTGKKEEIKAFLFANGTFIKVENSKNLSKRSYN